MKNNSPIQLRFDLDAVRVLMTHALVCDEHRPVFGQLFDPVFAKKGVVLTPGREMTLEQVDPFKIPPALHWVKDDGSYIMSNGEPRFLQDRNDPKSGSKVVYAEGFGPDADFDFVQNVLGGDDFVECIGLNPDLIESIRACTGGTLVLSVTSKSIEVFVEAAPAKVIKSGKSQ